MSNNNKTVVPEAKAALNQMKLEIANEIGLACQYQPCCSRILAKHSLQ